MRPVSGLSHSPTVEPVYVDLFTKGKRLWVQDEQSYSTKTEEHEHTNIHNKSCLCSALALLLISTYF